MNSPLLSLALCLAGLAFAVGIERLPSGLELQLPGGWQVVVSGQGAVIVPPGQDADAELYIAGVIPEMKSLDDTKMLPSLMTKYFPSIQSTSAGQPSPFVAAGGRGMVHSYDAHKGATPLKINLYLVGLQGRGVAVLAAVGKRELIAHRNAELLSVARSFHAKEAMAPPANSWTQRLSDKKLMQFSSYSSGGNSGGYNSERKLILAGGGTYAFRSSSSMSVYIPGASNGSSRQTQDQGRWRVIERGNDAMLELVSSKGATERIILTMQGTQTFLNGRRWFVAGINE
jgi:hypothetical protein